MIESARIDLSGYSNKQAQTLWCNKIFEFGDERAAGFNENISEERRREIPLLATTTKQSKQSQSQSQNQKKKKKKKRKRKKKKEQEEGEQEEGEDGDDGKDNPQNPEE